MNHQQHINTRRMRKFFLFLFFSWGYSAWMQAQSLQAVASNTPPFTPQNLISNIFLGEGVEVTNITFLGDPLAVGYFTGGASAIGIERGIVITSGRAQTLNTNYGCDAEGSDFASYANNGAGVENNLQPLVTEDLNDVCSYRISFIPTSDTLRFRYCFGSEEYPEYSCSPYNDVFGFFIEGPNYPVPTNIAIIPGTALPVAINNIHPANSQYPNCNPYNAQYYNANGGNSQPTYDGFTDVFVAQAIVVPCQEYTITLSIADVSDDIFDSGVFLEAKSFGTGSLRVEVETASLDGTITEGCSAGAIRFSLPEPANAPYPIDFNVWGDAIDGIDYTDIPDNLVIPAGETELLLPIEAFQDNTPEATEFLAIDVQRDPCNRDTVYIFLRENTLVSPTLRPDTSICSGLTPLELDGTLPIPLPQPATFSNTNDLQVVPMNTPVFSNINVFGVQPVTLQDGVIRSVCFDLEHVWDDDIDAYLISPGGQFLELTTDNGGGGDNYIGTCFTPVSTNPIKGLGPGPSSPASYAPFTGDWKPEGFWSDLWGGPTNGQWRLQLLDDFGAQQWGTLQNWSITFEPTYKVNYAWSPSAGLDCPDCPVVQATPVQTTTYVVVATDSYGCEVSDSVRIEVVPTLPAPNLGCGNATFNSVTFVWDSLPSSLGYEISINGGPWTSVANDTFYTLSGLPPSSLINAEVRGINPFADCGATVASGTCVNCASPIVTVATVDALCHNSPDGQVTLTPDGALPPYTFRIGANSNATGVFTNLIGGDYAATVTDGLGCDTILNFTIHAPDSISPLLTVDQHVSCYNGNDGQLSINTIGGVGAPYMVNWSSGGPTGLTAGSYSVTVSDNNGCTATATATIIQPDELIINALSTPVRCFGTATGSVATNTQGGVSPYGFAWSGGMGSAPNLNNILAGTYTVTLTDANGCTDTQSVTVTEPNILTATVSTTPTDCSDSQDGTATVVPNGGVSPYFYLWNTQPSQNFATAINLEAQTYWVIVTDANNCTTSASATPNSPLPLTLNLNQTPASCYDGENGTATVVASGGNLGYSFSWNTQPVQNLATAIDLAAGAYTVTVTDIKGCTSSAEIVVDQPSALLLTGSSLPASCFGVADGYAKVDAEGGVQPYQYSWQPVGSSSAEVVNVTAGLYTVTVTDAHDCANTVTVNVEQPQAIVNNLSPDPVLCFDGATGSITVTTSGGAGGFQYYWTGPNSFVSAQQNISNLRNGTYFITITDANGCTLAQSVNVNQPAAPLAAILPVISDTICFDASDGEATITATGGTTPYQFLWSADGQTTQTIDNLLPAVYHVTITDGNGCTASDSTYVVQKNQLFVLLGEELPDCHDGSNGSAYVAFASYGSESIDPFMLNYSWSTSPVQYGAEAFGLSAEATYSILATDTDGCMAEQEITITNPPLLVAEVDSVLHVLCHGGSTGQALAIASGGSGEYTYFWSPGVDVQSERLGQGMEAGTYRVTVTDSHGCYIVNTVEIEQPSLVQLDLTPQHVLCYGQATGVVGTTSAGGTPPYAYLWSNGETATFAQNLPAGMHYLSLTDSNNCLLIDSVLVDQPDAPLEAEAVAHDVVCNGDRDGSIQITGQGGTPPYQYALNQNPYNGSSLQIGLTAGIYSPQIIDAHGCEFFLPEVEIEQRSAVEVELGPDITIELGQSAQLLAEISNAAAPWNISWSPEDSLWLSCLDCDNPSVDELYYQNTFDIYVVDSLGCVAEDRITIFVEKPRKIFVPTGFTPNSDLNNDMLWVHGQESALIHEFRVYDRWGELLYEAKNFRPNDEETGWDGQFRSKPCNPGVYIWVLEVEYLDGVRDVLKGHTTLIR